MKTLNNNNNDNNRRKIPLLNNTRLATTTVAATIFTLTIIFVSATITPISASTTGENTTTTTTSAGEEEQEAVSSTSPTTNNASNALLGRLFSYLDEREDVEPNVNPVNETYIIVSYSGGNRIILPPNGTSVINATETANVTINIQPNGVSFYQGHAVIMTEGGAAAQEQENATISFVYLTRTNPDGSGSGTGVAYFSTNSTGQLAFLDNLVAIGQVEYAEGINRFAEWEWKGGTIPFENLIPQP
ncbi:MAG TPA: hypothetical protein VJ250_07405 [Nitrososphaeraceae archaeon]|nr:hypothetical protein [Nitrososphaeraceae archaeon]